MLEKEVYCMPWYFSSLFLFNLLLDFCAFCFFYHNSLQCHILKPAGHWPTWVILVHLCTSCRRQKERDSPSSYWRVILQKLLQPNGWSSTPHSPWLPFLILGCSGLRPLLSVLYCHLGTQAKNSIVHVAESAQLPFSLLALLYEGLWTCGGGCKIWLLK